MDNLAQVAQILTKAGYTLQDCQVGFLCITDPTCIWPPFLEFIHNAWIVLTFITGILLAGWGATMVRGANHDMVKNLRSLVLIFGVLSVALPAVNLLGAGRAVVNSCNTIKLSQSHINELVRMRGQSMQQPEFENFDIRDSNFDDLNSDFAF